MKEFFKKNYIYFLWGLVALILVVVAYLLLELPQPISPIPTPTYSTLPSLTPTDIPSPIATPTSSVGIESLQEGKIITGVESIHWTDPPLILQPFSMSATHPITVDLFYKLRLDRLDYNATYEQEIVFRGINHSLSEEWEDTTGQFDGEFHYAWQEAPYYAHYNELGCLKYLIHHSDVSTTTNPFVVHGYRIHNGQIVPPENENSCFALVRTIDNREQYIFYLPLIYKESK